MAQLFDPKGVGDYTRRALQRLKEYVDGVAARANAVNYVTNGGMMVWQRGTSFPSGTGAPYTADRWQIARSGLVAGMTLSRQLTGAIAATGGNYYCARIQRDAGNANTALCYMAQSFETINSYPLAGSTVTVSYYARCGADYSHATKQFGVQFVSGTGSNQNALTAGLTGSNVIVNTSVTTTTGWQRFTHTTVVPSDSTQQALIFYVAPAGTAGANDWVEVTGVQVERASQATPFEHRPYEVEFALCGRFFKRVQTAARGVWAGAGTFSRVGFPLVPPMRVGPTCSHSGNFNVWDGSAGLVTALTGVTYPSPQPAYVEVDGSIASAVMTVGRPAIFYLPHAGWFDCSAEL